MKTKTLSRYLFALALCLPLGAWADGENDSGDLSAAPGTEDSCQATFSVIEQTLNIPCVEVNAEGKSVLYSAQLQQVAEESFVLTQVVEQPEVLESGCKASYSLENGQLVVPCVTGRNPSEAGETEVVVLYADVPASPSTFVVGEEDGTRGMRAMRDCDARSSDSRWRDYCTRNNPFFISKNGGQCTAYAWGRAYEKTGTSIRLPNSGRDAKNWYRLVTDLPKGTQVQADSIAVWGGDSTSVGHVAYVERVVNGNVYFTEANVEKYSNTRYGGGVDDGGREKSKTVRLFENRGGKIGRIIGYIYLPSASPVQLTSLVVISPNPLVQNSPVTVTASIRNNGTSALSGYVVAALHNTGGTWLGDIQRYNNETIAAGQTRNYTFRKDAINSNPGSYRMQVKFSPDNVRWDIIPPGGDIPINVASTPTPIAKVNQTITFSPPASAILGSGPLTLSASTTSGLAVTFASTTPTICTVNGTTLTIMSAGTCTVTANQAGNTSYNAAAQVVGNIAITSTPTPAPIGTTLTQSGSWSSSGGRSETSSANPRYQFTVGSSGSVTIDLTSTPDNYLYLLDSSGSIIAQNDDTVGTNARIQSNLSVGTYTVVAATYNSGQIGSFTLSVVGNVSNLVASASPTPTLTYRLLSSSTTAGGGTWGAILQLTASLSGRTLTLTASKADGSAFSNPGTMYFKVGSYETYGVNRYTESVVAGNISKFYPHDLSSYSWDTQEKSFYVRFESSISTGGYAWVGPITVTQQ